MDGLDHLDPQHRRELTTVLRLASPRFRQDAVRHLARIAPQHPEALAIARALALAAHDARERAR
jgi:hypothetical protein